MITGNTGQNQLPMKKRAENVFAEIVKRNGIRKQHIEKRVLDHMLKKGMVKLQRSRGMGINHTIVKPVNMPPVIEEEVREPYAKRKAALDEAGLNYRGKKKEKETVEDLKRSSREFYFEIGRDFQSRRENKVVKAGIYLFEREFNSVSMEYAYHATRIWGVTPNSKVFYVKQRATNPKKGAKVSKEEFTWVKLKAMKVM